MNEIWNFANSIPHTILVIFFCVFIYVFIRLGIPLFYNIKNSILKVYNHNKQVFENGTDYLKSNALHDLSHILVKCHNKGYKTVADIMDWGEVRHHYKNLDGNKILDKLEIEFDKIPFDTPLEVPLGRGNAIPQKEQRDIMVDFYKKVNSGIIPPEEVVSPKNVISRGDNNDSKNN